MTKNVTIEVIENSGPNHLRGALRGKLAQASEVCIAVAFITESGLDEIIQPLRQVAAQGKVRIITGLYQHVTEPKALKTLLRTQTETRGKFVVRLSKEPQFHRKAFLIENRTRATAIVGSSNLTREGMRSGGELDLMVLFSSNAPSYKRLKEVFEKDWSRRRAVPLTSERIERYEKVRLAPVIQKAYTKGQLKKILGTKPSHDEGTVEEEPISIWRDYLSGFVRKRTERIISETTNWDDKRYERFNTGGRHPYRMGDQIFLFDFEGKRLSLVQVKDTTRTPIPTPDGRYFVAFKRVRNYSRRFSTKLWKQLEDVGISEEDAQGIKKVNSETAKHLMRVLRTTKSA